MRRRNVALDAVLLAVYAVVSLPALTGAAAHEWLGLAVGAGVFLHLLWHMDWAIATVKRAAHERKAAEWATLALDAALLLALALTAVSGLMISGAVLQALGLFAPGYFFWHPLHAFAAKLLLALVIVHVVLRAGAFFR